MRVQWRLTCVPFIALCAISVVLGQSGGLLQPGTPATPPPVDPGWPRQFTDGKAKLVLNQPQVDSWEKFDTLKGRIALILTPAKGAQPSYGTLTLEVDTKVDMDTRTVSYANFHVLDIVFPNAAGDEESQKLVALTKCSD